MGGGSQMGQPPGVVMMPELQHRMSKKIAQLTKVIYHLNNKNEDHGHDLADVSEQYETEIEQILRDTADKINAFKRMMEQRAEEAKNQNVVDALRAEHEAQKAAAMREFEEFKRRAGQRDDEATMAAGKANAQIADLAAEVEEAKAGFAKRLKEMEKSLKEAQAAAGAAAHNTAMEEQHAMEIAELKAAHHSATDSVVKKHNKKYNEMLTDRMAAEESLSEKNAALQAELDELRAKASGVEGEAAKAAAELRRRVAEAEEAVKSSAADFARQRAELADAAKKAEDAMRSKHEMTMEELRSRKQEIARLQGELSDAHAKASEGGAALNEALQTARAELAAEREAAQKLRDDNASLVADVAAAAAAGAATAEELAGVRTQLKQRDGEVKALEGMVRELEQALEAERVASAAVKDELRQLQKLREEEAKDAGSATEQLRALRDNEAKLSAKLADREAQIEKLKGDLAGEQAKLRAACEEADGLRAELSKLKASSAKDFADFALEANKKIKGLEVEVKRLEALADGSAAEAGAKMKKEYEAKLEKQRKDHLKAIEDAGKDFNQKLEAQKIDAAEKLATREEALRVQLAEAKRAADEALRSAKQDADKRVAGKAEEGQKVRNDLKLQIAELMKQINDEQRKAMVALDEKQRLEGEIEGHQRRATDAKDKMEASQRDFTRKENELKEQARQLKLAEEQAKKDKEGAVAMVEGLKGEIAAGKRQNEADRERAEERLATELHKRDEEWTKRAAEQAQEQLDAAAESHARELDALKAAMAAEGLADVQRALDDARAEHAKREAALREDIAAEQGRTREEEERRRVDLIAAAEHEKAELDAAAARAAAELAGVRSSHAAEVAEIRGEHGENAAAAAAKHAAEMEAAAAAAAAAAAEAAADAAEKLATAEEAARVVLDRTVEEWTTRYDADTSDLVAQRETQVAHTRQTLTDKYENEARAAAESRAKREKELTTRVGVLEKSEGLEKTTNDLANTRASAAENDTTLRRERAASEADIRGEHAAATAAATAAHEQDMAGMRAEQDRLVEEADVAYGDLLAQYDDIKARFDARESRVEDLQKIAELEGLVAHKENEMAQMASHQTQMKQEMNNREQNFTQTFGNGAANMNVQQGVMDWMLKKKDKNPKKPPARF